MRGRPALAIVCRTLAERMHGPAVISVRTLALWALLVAAAHAADAVLGPALPAGTRLALINIWAYVAIMVISAVISYALAPKPPQPKPAALSDFDVPTAEEGKPVCKVFGEYLVQDPNVLWWGDLSSKPIKKKTGKK